ncbi:MAG TPA: ExbD/TolR family protein [Thermoanaerobaculia bacterium]|nr:ExbD/TolR family protein [Thermoanaerobaculia bacterium]
MAFQIGDGGEDEVLSDINVTPLVDVMLVLLIIFMIATPMLHQGIEVALPKVDAQPLPLRDEDPMILTVTEEGLVFIQDEPVHPTLLEEKLKPIMASRNDEAVFIKGDANVDYGSVLAVIKLLQDTGTYRIGLVTDPAETVRRDRRRR